MTGRARKLSVTTIVGLLLVGFAGSVSAYWSTLGSGTGAASVATLNAPGAPTFQQLNETSVDITWTAPATSAPISLYKVFRAGTETFICQGTPPATTCSDNTIAPSTTYTYSVTAFAGSWTATSASVSYTTNAPAPAPGAPVITFPTAGAAYTTASAWDAGCATAGICGTATAADGQTVAEVEFSLKQDALYWSGAAFDSATEVWNLADGTTSWSKAFAFPAAGSYVLSVRSTDARPVTSDATTVSFTVGTAVVTPTYDVELVTAGTKTAGTAFDVKLTAKDNGAVLSTYNGAKTVIFTGPSISQGGVVPTYPATVTFSSGIGTASVTLTKAETVTLVAAESTRSGSTAVTVAPGSAARLAWTSITKTSSTAIPTPCFWTCTYGSFGNNSEFTGRVTVTDAAGNAVQNIGAGQTVSVSITGDSTFVPAGGPKTITLASSGDATSTTTFTLKGGNGQTWSSSLSASRAGLTGASATFSK